MATSTRRPDYERAPPESGQSHVADAPRDDREGRIAVAAYLRAARRGFAPGAELEDWLAAEKEEDSRGST
jgi:hypothetical protein